MQKPKPDETPVHPRTEKKVWWKAILCEPIALGLAVIVFLRPFWDGITFPVVNTYFLWPLLLLGMIWAIRIMLSGDALRFGKPLALLALFIAIAFVTSPNTVQFDATYRTILFWCGHLLLFVLVTNAVRSKTAIGIVLTAFAATALLETVWSFLHLGYVLPFIRRGIAEGFIDVREYFGTNKLSPELADRLMRNRAFGTFLFPNALAAFLIISIPFALGESVRSIAALRTAWRGRRLLKTSEEGPDLALQSTVVGLAVWLGAVCMAYFLYPFMLSITRPGEHWFYAHRFAALFWIGIVPIVVSAGPFIVTRLYGGWICWCWARSLIAPTLFALQLICLWTTKSRGGIIALAGAAVFCGILLLLSRNRPGLRRASPVIAVCIMFVAVWMVSFGGNISAAQNVVSQQSAEPPAVEINEQGLDISVKDLTRPETFWLRLGYWKSGLGMAKENLWTGVGIGNFGTVYPKYQLLGAGDVKAAHNDFLQALCETGLFGFFVFTGFWLYFVVWGARRILHEQNAISRWFLAGLYGGVLAFLAHSLVDFNFFNPSLTDFAFLFAGLFYSASAVTEQVKPAASMRKFAYQSVAALFLIGSALVLGASVRVFVVDYVLSGGRLIDAGNFKLLNTRFSAGQSLLKQFAKADESSQPAVVSVQEFAELIPSTKIMESVGTIRKPDPTNPTRLLPLSPDETVIPMNAVLVVKETANARMCVFEAAKMWLERLKLTDSIYPHIPDVSGNMFHWYTLLQEYEADPSTKRGYIVEALRWAEESVARSPEQVWYYDWYGRALWMRAQIETGPDTIKYLNQGLEAYKRMTVVYPTLPYSWFQYAHALKQIGNAKKQAGDEAAATALFEEAERATAQAKEMKKGSISPLRDMT